MITLCKSTKKETILQIMRRYYEKKACRNKKIITFAAIIFPSPEGEAKVIVLIINFQFSIFNLEKWILHSN